MKNNSETPLKKEKKGKEIQKSHLIYIQKNNGINT
jgi:hypothetical protein